MCQGKPKFNDCLVGCLAEEHWGGNLCISVGGHSKHVDTFLAEQVFGSHHASLGPTSF